MLDSFHKYPLFPDLLENQRRSIKFFWEKGILDELELFSTIIGYKKEKTGTPTNTEQKTFKKKQNEWNNSPSKLSGGYPPLPSKRRLGEDVVSMGERSSPLQKNKNTNFQASAENGEKFLGTKVIISQKTLKKLSHQSGNPKNTVLKTSVLKSQTDGNFGSSIQPFGKSNTIFKKNLSLSSVVKKRLPRFSDGSSYPQSKDGFLRTRQDSLVFSRQNLSRDPKTVLFQPLSMFAVSKRHLHQRKLKNKLKTKQIEISKNKNPDLLPMLTSFVLRKKEKILTLAGVAPGVNLPVQGKRRIWRTRGATGGHRFFDSSKMLGGTTFSPPIGLNKQNDSEYLVLHGSKFLVKAPHYSQSQAIKFQKTYSVGLFLPVSRQNLRQENSGQLSTHDGEYKNTSLLNICSVPSSTGLSEKGKKLFWFYFGDIPLMTDRGSFIINGAPRVLVNQIIRCPSVYFKVKLDHKNRRTYIASFLSEYGSWLRLETDRLSNRLWARIDKSPRFPADLLLMGLGYNQNNFNKNPQEPRWGPNKDNLSRLKKPFQKGENKETKSNFQNELKKGFPEKENGRFLNTSKPTLFNWEGSNLRSGSRIQKPLYSRLKTKEVLTSSNALKIEKLNETDRNSGLALQTIWKKCNPGRWTSSLGCYSFFYNKFLNPKRYAIGRVGRLRLNKRLLRNPECLVPTLTPEDILLAFNYLRQLRSADSVGNTKSTLELDDIDHLKNRRVRLPGEILQNQFRLALSRITYSAFRFQTETSLSNSKLTPESGMEYPRSAGLKAVLQQVQAKKLKSTEDVNLKTQISKVKFPNKSPEQKQRTIRQAQVAPFTGGTGGIGFFDSTNSAGGNPGESKKPMTPPPIPAFQNTLRELFNTGQLSQYMDQTNPLAEITHKRRLSSLGPGGVGRDQAGFAVREIHPSHFGRICPIETPEGQNAGLVGSLASYARINTDGFLQSPGVPIEQTEHRFGRLSLKGRHKISLFSSELEDEIYVCTADTLNPIFANKTNWQVQKQDSLNGGHKFWEGVTPTTDVRLTNPKTDAGEQLSPKVGLENSPSTGLIDSFKAQSSTSSVTLPSFFPVRYKQEFLNLKGTDALKLTSGPTKLFTGICPIQLISIATSLIPFLEHDDANRALMGSNMQRQAVPFMITEKPFVGTGLELQAARDSSTILLAKQSGKVTFVDANFIQIQKGTTTSGSAQYKFGNSFPPGADTNKKTTHDVNKEEIFSYQLTTFVPSNQSTSLKQRPAVQLGDWVEKGFLLADGSATNDGEVTLGKNVLLAYMPWEGYNFEDAIVINERLVFEDIYTSIHVERFEVDVKNTKILSLRSGSQDYTSTNEVLNGTPGIQAGVFSRLSPGEYLTSDLDILMLRFDGQQFTKNRSESQKVDTASGDHSDSGTYSDKSQAFRRPESLSHLDERGIVKPGAWVQEGDILVGKVQIGQKDTAAGAASSSRTDEQYIGTGYPLPNDKNGNLQSSARSLPFPEYRLLLAIFDLQNNRNAEGGNPRGGERSSPTDLQNRVERNDYLLSAEKKLLENEMNLSNGGFLPKTGNSTVSADTEGAPGNKIPVGFDGGTRNETGRIENSLLGTGSVQTSHPIRNTSVKVGIGVKGRVLECVLDGELIKYKKTKENLRENLPKEERKLSPSPKGPSLDIDKDILKESCSSVSIFLAHKKRIQLGDKMSGRHGNKGIVSLILPPQDMPYLQDGKAVDVVLNPLGVPSRMNVGQVLETLFGLSAFYYKKVYRIMPFDERINPVKNKERVFKGPLSLAAGPNASVFGLEQHGAAGESKNLGSPKAETSRSLVYGHLKRLRTEIQKGVCIPQERALGQGTFFEHTQIPISEKELTFAKGNQLNWLFDPNNPGKTQVFDGRTGEIFYQPVLVGYSYMFKLIHLVDDKIHARSTGPYSLVTQQPLGGRSKKGGQRLGEMEVWALQGFGTASILQEFLTVKSDEIYSRNHFLFHLMRRNWDSLEKIPALKRLDKESVLSRNQSLGAGVSPSGTQPGTWGASESTKQSGFNDTTATVHSKLPESFRVLINELHALCLSVYSNLPN